MSNVLPLKNIERKRFVDLNCFRVLSKEIHVKSSILMFKLLWQVIPMCLTMLLDVKFYQLIEVVAKHSRIDYMQEGFHRLNITVKGSTFVSDYIRRSIEGFNFNENITIIVSNEPCLPRPMKVESSAIFQIIFLIFIQIYLIYNQPYIQRVKLIVLSIFYPQREALRIRFLHKRLLDRRRKVIDEVESRIREQTKIDGKIEQRRNILQVSWYTIHSMNHWNEWNSHKI